MVVWTPSHKLFSYQGYICYKNPGVIQESQNQIYKSKALEPSQTSADKEAVGKKSYPPCWTKNSPLANHFLCKMLESDVHDHQQSSHGFVCRDSNINRPRSKLSAESSVMQLTQQQFNFPKNNPIISKPRHFGDKPVTQGFSTFCHQTSCPKVDGLPLAPTYPEKTTCLHWIPRPHQTSPVETWPRDVKARGQRQERPICGIKITAWPIWEGPNMTQRTQPNNVGNSAMSSLESLSRTWKMGCSTWFNFSTNCCYAAP